MAATLIYLHGFNSSPHSRKACQLGDYLAAERPDIRYRVPQLPSTPAAAWARVEQSLAEAGSGPIGLVGSSLGGFFATGVALRHGVPAVVVNPAVRPQALLAGLLGAQHNPYTGEHYRLEPRHLSELQALDDAPPDASARLWLLQQSGDEVLDYRQALAHYRFARVSLELGGNHAFNGFERYCAQIVRFLEL